MAYTGQDVQRTKDSILSEQEVPLNMKVEMKILWILFSLWGRLITSHRGYNGQICLFPHFARTNASVYRGQYAPSMNISAGQ
jgi:hypothetical protein